MLAGHDPSYLRVVWLVASALGVTAIAVLAVLFRRARDRLELEEAERIIADDDQSS